MFNKKLSLTIKNILVTQEDVTKLLQAIKKHCGDVEILKIFVFEDYSAYITEFDGIAVTKWYFKDVYELIYCYNLGIRYEDTKIVEMI